MANWKEIGEVPDSDDEAWESEDSLQCLSPPQTQIRSQPHLEEDDVWEFSGSPSVHSNASSTVQTVPVPPSLPQSPASANVEENAGLGEKQLDPPTALVFESHRRLSELGYGSPDPLTDVPIGKKADLEANHNDGLPNPQDEGSLSIARVHASPTDLFPVGSIGLSERRNSLSHNNDKGNESSTSSAAAPPARGRRSLRPRKPIQEHPYLLENAQYSKAFKSHGLKPIRIAAAEQMAAKRRHNDSQDQDFDEDESQSNGVDEESQGSLKMRAQKVADDDLDELALSQSPRTSSPQRHLRASSEQSPGQQTDNTSVHEDEFPDIKDLVANKKTLNSMKRRKTRISSTSRKRPRTKSVVLPDDFSLQIQNNAWEPRSSPEPVFLSSTRREHIQSPIESPQEASKTSYFNRSISPEQLSPAPRSHTLPRPIDLTSLTADSEEGADAQDSDDSSSDSESDLIRRTGKRIRGVLPASWLRLDQQTRKKQTRITARKSSIQRSPDQPRPGLATLRAGLLRHTVSTNSFLDDLNESDGENPEVQQIAERAAHVNQEQILGDVGTLDFDDNASVVEDNFVDWMLPGQKRKHDSSAVHPRKKKKIRREGFQGAKRYRQPKILASMQHLDSLPNGVKSPHFTGTSGHQAKRAISPPALSIVDVVQARAPNFIKIAARAAIKRHNLGRSKPSTKSINLGNRADNIDALSVLKRWKNGTIKQKTTRPVTQQKIARSREALRPVALNSGRPPQRSAGLSFNQPRKVSKQVSSDNLTSARGAGVCSQGQSVKTTKLRSSENLPRGSRFGYRPAQLEADVLQDDDLGAFGSRKRMLDLVFRKSRGQVLAPAFQLRNSVPDEKLQPEISEAVTRSEASMPQLGQLVDSATRKMPRSRKRIPPRRLDLEAPQYKYANDPLPFYDDRSSPIKEVVQPQYEGSHKIIGLGPFGTHYTQHFDIFPLHGDIYFHHTTIIGDGTLSKALTYQSTHRFTSGEPALTFEFSNYRLQWARWTDATSSELGLLFDLIAEHIETIEGVEGSLGANQIIDGAAFIQNYVLEFAGINAEADLKPFIQRMFGLLVGFMNDKLHSESGQHTSRILLETMSRFLVCALVLLRLSQSTEAILDQVQQAEDLLKQIAQTLIQRLLSIGLSDIRATYDDLRRPLVRERGIRRDNVTMITWVVVMKILGAAQIPKTGFWDLVSLAMTSELTQDIDAQVLERTWRDMYTLLPLTEFDDAGILSKGLRFVAPLQGWSLPQKLLKVVFESYQANQRQSPSFNGYCRALLARCHYLIEQWGWQRCIGVAGTIFDFFGSQDLSHLRNEEVYKSPRFLEELSDEPFLSVEPEDRAFHIFLKILAVAILGMKRHGLFNDIQNLITRCLPNHSRQYSKEQGIHSRDLASLRNHHDLLCTLFWAAPPEFRRPVALIEDLVRPASSHKEACLINLRAWSQLTRFVVSTRSSIQDYRPFISWQNNIFHSILNQYLSAASDVEHQFMSMAKEDRGKLQKELLDSVVSANQNAAKDVLYFSVIASLDVMRHCSSLTVAMSSFNVSQMTKCFNKLMIKGADLDWGILRASFDTVDLFVSRLEGVWSTFGDSTGDSVSTHINRDFEDAVEFLDDKVLQSFVAAARKAMLSPAYAAADQPACLVVEKAIILCGRIASLFIDGGKSSLAHFFSAGKYGLFEALPDELSLVEWRALPLFVSTLLRKHVFNFSSIGCTHFDLWISSLVKPGHSMRYEADLAETLRKLEVPYMKGTGNLARTAFDYGKRRDLFAKSISHMRREVRQTDFAQRKSTRAKYERVLKSVMRQIRSAIQSLQLKSAEHLNYIKFIRDIIGLIKSHAADICSIDPYFYQVSEEYSPPKEDPQLHTAGILAYGIRLGEGETTAIPQLFSYLYNHFKTSLASGHLEAEVLIIENGMRDDTVLTFVIGRMLPAIIQATSHSSDIWPLLAVYAQALYNSLTRSCLSREVPEAALDDALTLLTSILTWAHDLRKSSTELTPAHAHIFAQLLMVCNAIRPSLACWLLQSSITTSKLQNCVVELARVAKHAAAVLSELHAARGREAAVHNISVKDLILAEIQPPLLNFDSHVNIFTQNLLRDVQSNWIVTPDHVTVRVAATQSTQPGTQGIGGVIVDLQARTGLLSELLEGLKVWVSEMGDGKARSGRRIKRRNPRFTPTGLHVEF